MGIDERFGIRALATMVVEVKVLSHTHLPFLSRALLRHVVYKYQANLTNYGATSTSTLSMMVVVPDIASPSQSDFSLW